MDGGDMPSEVVRLACAFVRRMPFEIEIRDETVVIAPRWGCAEIFATLAVGLELKAAAVADRRPRIATGDLEALKLAMASPEALEAAQQFAEVAAIARDANCILGHDRTP